MPKYHPRLIDVPAVEHRYIYRHGWLIPFPPDDSSDEILLAFAKAVAAPDTKSVSPDLYFGLLGEDRISANDDTDEPRLMFYPEPWDAGEWTEMTWDRKERPAPEGWPLPEDKAARDMVKKWTE